jgi:hypothetical protein
MIAYPHTGLGVGFFYQRTLCHFTDEYISNEGHGLGLCDIYDDVILRGNVFRPENIVAGNGFQFDMRPMKRTCVRRYDIISVEILVPIIDVIVFIRFELVDDFIENFSYSCVVRGHFYHITIHKFLCILFKFYVVLTGEYGAEFFNRARVPGQRGTPARHQTRPVICGRIV